MLHPPGPVFFIAPTQHITPGVVIHFRRSAPTSGAPFPFEVLAQNRSGPEPARGGRGTRPFASLSNQASDARHSVR